MSFDDLLDLWSEDTALQLAAASAAIAAGNLPEAARLVHSASGASGICGVASLAQELKLVESLAAQGKRGDAASALAHAQARFAGLSGALHNAE
ncbi:MAG TPA: Hpt domain-containing protein [Vicinamibacterales bacterium]|nr:Hpt domain-containing protein [Vicinamibacterales bacterium]